jgi:hypothetical protein
VVGKRRTQQLERKHLTLRTRVKRLVRKTICFSKSVQLHEIFIGLSINRFEFGLHTTGKVSGGSAWDEVKRLAYRGGRG